MNPASFENSPFLNACRLKKNTRVPVWFLRQAGRYMAAYRQLRSRHTLLQMVKDPQLAAEVTLQPVKAFGVDAAIIFADILPPLETLGFQLEFVQGEGPLIRNPIREAADLKKLKNPDVKKELGFTFEAIRKVRQELDPLGVPLIGFAGAPFTLASYAIEGGGGKDKTLTKTWMRRETPAWRVLMETLAQLTAEYLTAQVEAGAQAVQLFDSWVGELSPEDYRSYVAPYSHQVLSAVSKLGVPVLHFGTGTAGFLEDLRDAGGDVIGLDWRVDPAQAAQRLGPKVAVQGNLDPTLLLAPWEVLRGAADRLLDALADRPGFIFNVGHGLGQTTPEDNVARLVEYVHARRIV
jgi:uroporphyrinogen decarboxylase